MKCIPPPPPRPAAITASGDVLELDGWQGSGANEPRSWRGHARQLSRLAEVLIEAIRRPGPASLHAARKMDVAVLARAMGMRPVSLPSRLEATRPRR